MNSSLRHSTSATAAPCGFILESENNAVTAQCDDIFLLTSLLTWFAYYFCLLALGKQAISHVLFIAALSAFASRGPTCTIDTGTNKWWCWFTDVSDLFARCAAFSAWLASWSLSFREQLRKVSRSSLQLQRASA